MKALKKQSIICTVPHEMLEGNTNIRVSMTTKWDGVPAIVAGRDPASGKFFVGTKGVFAQKP